MTDLSALLRSVNRKKGLSEVFTISGCDICGEPHATKSCSLLADAKHVQDSKIPSRARLTLPQNLEVCDLENGMTTVIAQVDIDRGSVFGPLQASHSAVLPENTKFPLKVFGNTEEDSYYLNTVEEDFCNWMCLVSPAASTEHQNLICYQANKEIFFVVVRVIKAGEELKVWYAPYYAVRMVASAYKVALDCNNKKSNCISEVGNMVRPDGINKKRKITENKMKSGALLNTEVMQKVAEQLPAKRLGACRVPEKWRCRKCGKEETSVVAYAKHLMKHFKPAFSDTVQPIECHLCNRMFTSEKLLVKHKVVRHGAVVQRPVLLADITEDEISECQKSSLEKLECDDKSLNNQNTDAVNLSDENNLENDPKTSFFDLDTLSAAENISLQNDLILQANNNGEIIITSVPQCLQKGMLSKINEAVSDHPVLQNSKTVELLLEDLKRSSSDNMNNLKHVSMVVDSNSLNKELLKYSNESSTAELQISPLLVNGLSEPQLKIQDSHSKSDCLQVNSSVSSEYNCGAQCVAQTGENTSGINIIEYGKSDYEFLMSSSQINKFTESIKSCDESNNVKLDSCFSQNQKLEYQPSTSSLNAVVVPEDGNSYRLILNENSSETIEKDSEKSSSDENRCLSNKVTDSVINMLTAEWELVTGSDDDSASLIGTVMSSNPTDKPELIASPLKCSSGDRFSFGLDEVPSLCEIIQAAGDKCVNDLQVSYPCDIKSVENTYIEDGQSCLTTANLNLDDTTLVSDNGTSTSYMFNMVSNSHTNEMRFSESILSSVKDTNSTNNADIVTNIDKTKLNDINKDVEINKLSKCKIKSPAESFGASTVTTEEQQVSTKMKNTSSCGTSIVKNCIMPQDGPGNTKITTEASDNKICNNTEIKAMDAVRPGDSLLKESTKENLNTLEDNFDSSNQSFLEAVLSLEIASNDLGKFSIDGDKEDEVNCTTQIQNVNQSLLEGSGHDNKVSFNKREEVSEISKKQYVLDTGPPYNCDICDKEFHKAIYLYRHLKKHAGEFVCVSCLTVFARKENLLNHSCYGTDKSKFLTCTFCQKKFSTKLMLRRHMVKHIGGFAGSKYLQKYSAKESSEKQAPLQPNMVRCPVCQREFRYLNLCRHLQQHRTLRPCKCCGRSLPGNIALHEAYCSQDSVVQSGKEAECPDCKSKFSDASLFRLHVFQHTHPHACQICRQAFRTDKDKYSHKCKNQLEKCPVCPQELTSLVELEQHIVSHELPQFHCFDCGRSFLKPDSLLAHTCNGGDLKDLSKTQTKTRKPKNRLICEVCGEVCHTYASLRTHAQLHVSDNCTNQLGKNSVCPQELPSLVGMEQETVSHELPQFQCFECGIHFLKPDSLLAHTCNGGEVKHLPKTQTKTSNPKNRLICEVCGEVCHTHASLSAHSRLHGNRKFQCEICQKRFLRSDLLQAHLAVHGEPQIPCPECHKKVKTKKSLMVHMRQHTGTHLFKCDKCGKGFNQKINLHKHLQVHEDIDKRKQSCRYCGKTFLTQESLKVHELKHTQGQPHSCPLCNKAFVKEIHLRNHIKRLHTDQILSCPFCAMTFKHRNSLSRHLERRHAELRNQWNIPNFLDTIAATKQDLLSCPYCTETFKSSNLLFLHLEKNHINLRNEWSMQNFLQTVAISTDDPDNLTTIPEGPEFLLTVSNIAVAVENPESNEPVTQNISESQNQTTDVALENAFILDDGTIVQSTGTDVNEFVLYVLDNENVCINPELQPL